MKKQIIATLLTILMVIAVQTAKAQNSKTVHPSLIGTGVFLGETPPLRDLPAMSPAEFKAYETARAKRKELNEELEKRSYPYAKTAFPKGPDPLWQKTMGPKSAMSNSPIQNFAGQASSSYPPDCNGAVGPNHFMQTVNVTYSIYNKTGTLLAGPTAMNTLFSGVTGATYNDGDPVVLYDEQAQRFLAVEFSLSGSNDYMLVAVSSTSDPTGTWYKYSFDVADTPDYPKFGIWQDGYYMGVNNSSGNDTYVFQRSVMLTGGVSPQMIGFDNANRPTSIDGFMCVPPVDNDGTFAPAGSPAIFIAFNDDAIGGGSDQLWIYELSTNWTTPASSTFTRTQQLAVGSFDSNFGTDWYNITQPGTTMQLDAIPQVIMNVPQYRNFGTYQTLVCCHTVDVDATDHAGVRWYELRRGTQTSGNWAIRQQGTYAPDANSRWMGSIMLNGSGKIGLGYSVSSGTIYPSIRYTGQSSAAYSAGTGVMDITEENIQTGAYSQTSYERWGDYAQMSVDPTDDQTFWFTTEYNTSSSNHGTRIASFKLGNSPLATTLAASSVTGTSATINGSVNPNGLATTYYFDYGTSASYGSTTSVTSAGSGSSAIAVSANLTGLAGGVTYHFRVVATNSDGTSTGGDLTFVPGGAVLTTTAASSVTQTTASSGGNITSDGGSSIIARGVCWSTAASPTISGSHTSDGTGTGTFISSITGLTSSTLYHVRAYATNGSGTFYGDDLTFTTVCGIISTFPWTEGFENGGVIPNCWSQEQVASSGLNWTFITGNGGTAPTVAHGGTYNACLKDATAAANVTRLITPSLNLSSIGSPTLTFWHTQALWSPDQDLLTVYYRTSSTGTWTQLAAYTASITTWTQETIVLPNATADYYIDFEGSAKYGYGVCIDDVSITGTSALATLTTTAATAITAATATSGGTISSQGGSAVTVRGVCWATTANPTISNSFTSDGSGTGTFISSITGLSPNTLYHVRAYATNTGGTAYGSDLTFTTLVTTPTVTTTTPATITNTTAAGGGNVTSAGGGTITARGVCWSTTASPTILNSLTSDGTGTGAFTSSMTGLTSNTLYHVRAYATNSAGTSYGSDLQFTTLANPPTVTTTTPSSITANTASGGGNVTSAGDASVTARGVCWAITANPLVTDSHTTDGSGTGVFTSSITGLSPNTLYHVRAYATNTGGTSYGSDILFTTSVAFPTVTTTTPSSIYATSATSGGNVTSAGGGTITARGVCWAITSNPSLSNSFTTDGGGTGTYVSSLSGLSASTLYHVRAYATNITGTSYGSDLQFTTSVIPTLSVTPANQNVASSSGSTSFTVTSNSAWTASSDQSWCTVTASGSGNGTITANFTTNTLAGRVANITVTVGGLSPIVVTVTQAGAPPSLSVAPSNQAVVYTAASTSFSVTSNAAWTASSDQTWCTVTPSGSGNGTITANFTQNTTYVSRLASITVTVTGLTPVVVTVTQDAAPVPEFTYTMENDVQVSDKILEFDLYLLDPTPATAFELATIQAGILVNSAIYGGGTITASIVAGTSQLSTNQQPTNITFAQTQNCLKLAPKSPPGTGSGTIIATSGQGTRICRIRLTNSVAFAEAQANLAFNFPISPYPTKVFQYQSGLNVLVLALG